jgi:hypothetical protein
MNRTWKQIIIWIGGIFIVLVAIHATLVAITGKRLRAAYAAVEAAGRPMTAEEIIPAPVEEDNAAPLYKKAFALMEVLEPEDWFDVHSATAETNAPSAEAMAAAQAFIGAADTARLLELVTEAAAKPACRFERDWSAGAGMLLPDCGTMRNITRLLYVKTLVEAQGSDGAAVGRSLTTGLRTAEAYRDDPILISQLVRTAQIGIMLDAAADAFGRTKVPDDAAAALVRQIREMKGSRGFVKSMDGERLFMGEWAFALFETREGARKLATMSGEDLRPRQMRYYGARLVRPLLQVDHAAYIELILRMTEEGAKPPHETNWEEIDLAKQIPRYCILTSMLLPALHKAADAVAAGETRLEIADAALAVIRHKARHGAYPSTVDALDKELLPAWPVDPFSGRPLVYRSTEAGFKIYSIGANRKDDDGQKGERRDEGDIVWQAGAVDQEVN